MLVIVEGPEPALSGLLDALGERDFRTEVLDVAQLGEEDAHSDFNLDHFDKALALLKRPPSVVFERFVEFARLSLPVWVSENRDISALSETRSIERGEPTAIVSRLFAETPAPVEKSPGGWKDTLRGKWLVLALIMAVAAGSLLLFRQAWDDVAAKRAVASSDLAEMDAYLATWQTGYHRDQVARERVSRVSLALPELTSLSGNAEAPKYEDRAWLDFDANDWGRLPAVTLLRIADEKHGIPAIAAAAMEGDGKAAHLLGTAFLFGAFFIEPDAETAEKLFGAACAVGLQRGCFNVGHTLSNHGETEEDRRRGFELFVESCDKGLDISCVNVSFLVAERGQEFFPDATQISLLEQYCAAGSDYLCGWLGRTLYWKENATDAEKAEGFQRLEDACAVSNAIACEHVAEVLRNVGETDAEKKRALQLSVVACNGGLSDACGQASEGYYWGRGAKQDTSKMLYFAEKACTYGGEHGCFRLGYELSNRDSKVTNDLGRARKYYNHACTKRLSAACFNQGLLYQTNRYGAGQNQNALSYFEKACELSDWKGCAFEGQERLKLGQQKLGADLLQTSCDKDDKWGCFNLGTAFISGDVGKIDHEAARQALDKALTIDPEFVNARNALEELSKPKD